MSRACNSRRAFALPVVVLLALVAGLAGAVLLEIGGNANLATRRQVDAYKSHHIAIGFKDMLDSFLMMAGADIEAKLGDNGLAFELFLESGPVVRAYIGDEQGTLLTDAASLTGPQRQFMGLALAHLESSAPEFVNELVRKRGPIKVSVFSAPREVLEALGVAAGDEQAAAKFADAVVSGRDGDERLTSAEGIGTALRDAGFDDEQVRAMQEVLTSGPVLWRVVIESSPSTDSADITERLQGLIMLGETELNIAEGGSVVLEWEDRTHELADEVRR